MRCQLAGGVGGRFDPGAVTPGGTDDVRVEVDGDDDVGPHGAGQGHRHRIDERTIDEQAAVLPGGGEKARERDGGSHGGRDAAFAQPDFVAALEISGDAAEAVQQRGEITVDEVALKETDELVALDEAAAQAHVHQADDVLPAEGFDPAAELFQIAGRSDGTDEGPDGATADDLRLDALPRQRPQHPHMRPAPGGAAAKGDADAGGAFHGGLVVGVGCGRNDWALAAACGRFDARGRYGGAL